MSNQHRGNRMSEHTPGPWVAGSEPWGWDIVGHSGTVVVAQSDYCEGAEANARLIAAAPELLAAAEDALQFLADNDPGPHLQDCPVFMGLAIAIRNATEATE